MAVKHNFFKVLFSIVLVASIVLANVSVVFADDGTPPPEETTTPEPTEQVEIPETSTPEVEEPVTPTTEVTPTPEVEEPTPEAEETPLTEEQVPAEAEPSDIPLFEQVPEGTDIVVLDENGELVPLVTQEALDTILDTDPMWCPDGVLPGGPGCTQNFATISALLQNMRNNTGNYTQDGIIYFTANTGGSFSLTTASSSLGNSDFNTLNDFDLTLQGGWNGLNGTNATFTGQTNFGSGTLTIGTSSNPWAGNITINDFTFNNANGNAITVYTTSGDVALDNVTVTQQGGDDYTAYIDSQSGDITVSDSSFDGNSNSGSSSTRNRGFHAETNTGSIIITNTEFKDSRSCSSILFWCLDATTNSNGATLSAPTVTLTDVTAYNNDLNGIEINNANSIWLNNVVSYNNGTFVLVLGLGSGVNVNGTGSTVVNVNGGSLSDNESYGLSVFNGTINASTDPACDDNRYPGPHPSQCYNQIPVDTIPPVLSLPANITTEATRPSGAQVTFSATATDAVDGSVAVNCSPASGSVFPTGSTTVNCSASDTSNNTATGSFNVTVQDTTAPVLTPPADITTEATGASGAAVTFSASATDIVDGSVTVICSPASGSTFPVGTTAVNCSATDAHNNTSSGSFNVTVGDTTPPVIATPTNIVDKTDNPSGTNVKFTPPTTFDLVDGAGVATCTPASGTKFPIGTTIVTCTAIDSHSNAATPVTFLVTLKYTGTTTNTTNGFLISVTGGELIDLDCFTILNAFGIKVTFHNLCEHQSIMDTITADTLPAALPDGYAFVKGLNIAVLFDGEIVKELPLSGGVQLDFPITANAQDQYAVLLWDNENKEWLEVTQLMKDEELAKMLSTDVEDELYQITATELTQSLYRILSTEKTGTFVIVKK